MRVKFLVVKIPAEQAEFPEVVGDVFADVRDSAVGAHDDFRVGELGGLVVRLFGFGNGSFFSEGSSITQQAGFFPLVDIESRLLSSVLEGGVPEFQV